MLCHDTTQLPFFSFLASIFLQPHSPSVLALPPALLHLNRLKAVEYLAHVTPDAQVWLFPLRKSGDEAVMDRTRPEGWRLGYGEAWAKGDEVLLIRFHVLFRELSFDRTVCLVHFFSSPGCSI